MRQTHDVNRLVLGAGGMLLFLVACAAHAAQTCVQPPAGIAARWPGDGNAEDSVGSNDSTVQGGVTFITGKVAQAFGFKS